MNPTVRVRNLCKVYGEVTALRDVSFEVGHGEIVGLLGPNGAGKTTALEILCALRLPTSGSVEVCGVDPLADPRGVQTHLGTVLQSVALDPVMTPLEAITLQVRLRGFAPRVARAQAVSALRSADLADLANRRIGKLSGGQQRRVDLATAVIGDPPVLLLDEPTTGLDPESRLALWERLRQLASKGTAILLSTQDLHEAESLTHRVVILREGRVVASASPADLKRDVGTRSLIVTLRSRAQRDQALRIARRLRVPAGGDGGSVCVHVRLGADDHSPGDYIAALSTSGIDVVNLNLDEPTLDDVFLRLTHPSSTPGDPHA
ncbi:MAG: ABC transporter ATP-binding protein [Demequinaceae bacterium]|nr:ABC transporter ATP-binding protein [Demequinaceae bacterium]